MIRSTHALGLAFALAFGASTAHADPDELMACKIMIVKAGTLQKVVCKGTFALPTAPNAPDAVGASVTFEEDGGGSVSVPLPAGSWQGLGSPAGSKGYKYHDPATCPVVLVKTTVVKAVCKVPGTLPIPLVGDALARIQMPEASPGKRYCARFGGEIIKNDESIFKAKLSSAPADCSSTPVACNCCGFTQVSFAGAAATGPCGDVKNLANTSTLMTLACGGFYEGGSQGGVTYPLVVPELGETRFNVSSCNVQTGAVALAARSAAATGSAANCSEMGCLYGAPIPVAVTGGVFACVANYLSANASGDLDCLTGTAHLNLPITARVDISSDPTPCPICSSGMCDGGPNLNQRARWAGRPAPARTARPISRETRRSISPPIS